VRIRQEIRESKESKEKSTEKTTIGKQYPSLAKPEQDVRQTMTALSYIRECAVSDLFDDDDSLGDMDINDDDFFENMRHIKMVSVHGEFWDKIEANFRVAYKCVQGGKLYAISDGGADSCILESSAHMINLTKCFARLVGYGPDTTQSARVPIASGYIKTKFNGNFILLLINEAPYLAHSPTTLLSEYQIREYGKVIYSCSETHMIFLDPHLMGKQRLDISAEIHIPMEDREAIMGIPIFQYEEGDDTRYPIHEITSKSTWVPYCYRHHQISADTSTTVTLESHDTLIAASAYVTNAEARVDTVDDDDELTQRHDNDFSDECYIDMPGLQQRLDDDSSSDDDSLSYQREFEIDTIDDSGETATVTINKVEHVNENNADPPDEITFGQITQAINNKTNRTTH
jgi:hypothetical protein